MRRRSLVLLATSIVPAMGLLGCASMYEPVPVGFPGPVARLVDSGASDGMGKAQIFVASGIDGKPINNSILKTRRASSGYGFKVNLMQIGRDVPVVPMKVKILATHITSAPIHEIVSRAAGAFYSVEGVVDFLPVADGSYVVRGDLKREGSSVWIENLMTGQQVTEKITSKP